MPYSRPYASGFQDYPSTTTPINSTALNTMDVGIKTANDQFQTVTTAQRTALSPTVGQCVWDSDLRQLMVYMNATGGNAWQPIGNAIVCTSTTRPSTPFEGQVIRETDTNKEFTYSGSAWVQTNTWGTTTGVTGVNNLIVPPSVSVYNNTDQTVATATFTRVSFTNSSWDTDSMKGAGTVTGVSINTTGLYQISAYQVWDTNATGTRAIYIDKGTSTSITTILAGNTTQPSNANYADNTVSVIASLTAGDTIQVFGWQNSGGNLKVVGTGPYPARALTLTWIGRTS